MDALKRLLQTKKLIALMLTVVFSVLSIKGTVTAQDFVPVFMIVIGYYYGQSTVRHTLSEDHDSAGEVKRD